jgi:hypothetical protein
VSSEQEPGQVGNRCILLTGYQVGRGNNANFFCVDRVWDEWFAELQDPLGVLTRKMGIRKSKGKSFERKGRKV